MDLKQQASGLKGAIEEFASRGLILYFVLFVVEIALFFVVASLPFLPGEQALYTNQSNQISNQFQGASLLAQFWGIFVNNFRIAMIEMIPGLGAALFAFSLYSTARILEVIAITDNTSPLLVLVLLLLLFPHSYLELPAYAVATGEGLYLLYAIWRWAFSSKGRSLSLRTEGWQLAINILIVAVMLLLAALFESVEIQLGALFFWTTWPPFVGLIIIAVYLNRRMGRMRKEKRAGVSSERKMDDSSHLSV